MPTEPAPSYSLGIDIGGTFTDIVVHDHASGRQWSRKVLTTHDDPARAVATGVAALLDDGRLAPTRVTRVVHATTLFTNALIERKGASTGLITTAGFADTLEIGRERKFELYDLNIEKAEPLVPRNLRLEVAERIRADGAVKQPLAAAEVAAQAQRLSDAGVASIAIVFLHSYANPRHEAEAARIVTERHPEIAVTASHEVAAEIREYERASTTVANAYIKPLARRYLDRMERRVEELGIAAPLLLMLSSGGLTHVAEAGRTPVQMLESGPAAGAIAAAFFGREDSGGDLLAFDMGGTTAKLSLVDAGEPLTAYSFEAARQKRFIEGSGFPIRISTIELIEIGAGGGSIARVDEIGLLKVGPRSAGSQPGPASYGLGGTEPTVTDADFLLGYLNPDYFAGGEVKVDMAAARAALARLAERVGLSPTAVAWGVHDIVNENMASAARVHIAERGRDPRGYALLCTGGAGPVHAYSVARKLGLARVICPPSAGVASALGLLVAPARVDRVATVGLRLDRGSVADLENAFRRLEDEALAVLADTGLKLETATVRRLADGRFLGQGFDLVVSLPGGPYADTEGARRALQSAFEAAYREKFALTPPDVPVEFINVRVAVRAPVAGSEVAVQRHRPGAAGDAVKGTRPAYFPESGGFVEATVYDRYRLAAGDTLAGPAVVEEEGSTLVLGPGASAGVTESGNLLVTLAPS
ncbi:MAG TPA: hydantoinase/oxoprolinase family protein [Methylomirabilota bacterium]|jgi:N-methylhydantoinase A|nr:hydantoinase/oxoprolinase family protein [Methylomirabilota bacterium]